MLEITSKIQKYLTKEKDSDSTIRYRLNRVKINLSIYKKKNSAKIIYAKYRTKFYIIKLYKGENLSLLCQLFKLLIAL